MGATFGVNPYSSTPREFANIRIAYFQAMETKERGEWERTRWLAALLMGQQAGKVLQPTDIVRFPWEKTKGKELKEHIDEVMKMENYKKMFPDKI